MTGKDILMSVKEVKVYEEIKRVISGEITQVRAAVNLGISARHMRRLVRRFKANGEKGLIHGLRGKPSNRRIDEGVKEEIIDVYAERYKGFSLTLAAEKMLETDLIKVNRESLRQMLLPVGLWEPVRKGRKHRTWRERKACFGEMAQLDGSIHDWLEGRGPVMVLMSFIDDATSNTFGRFFTYEGTIPAMTLLKRYIKKYGIPRIIYLDRHSTYKSQREATIEEQLKNEKPMSQFERACRELGIEVVHAWSPQAKGRIERSFKTHQDRLVKEMRLANVCTMEDANKFLDSYYMPKHNKKFSVAPASNEDMHVPLRDEHNMDKALMIRTERTVRNDYTISHDGSLYQLTTRQPLKGKKVLVLEKLNLKMKIEYKGEEVGFKKINKPIKVEVEEEMPREKVVRKARIRCRKPIKSHPWLTGDNWVVNL